MAKMLLPKETNTAVMNKIHTAWAQADAIKVRSAQARHAPIDGVELGLRLHINAGEGAVKEQLHHLLLGHQAVH